MSIKQNRVHFLILQQRWQSFTSIKLMSLFRLLSRWQLTRAIVLHRVYY